jgi:hypothetical protein
MTEISPYINISINIFSPAQSKHDEGESNSDKIQYPIPSQSSGFINTYKPIYKQTAVFRVLADIQFDIYHLYAVDAHNTYVYYNVACIPDIKTSVFMNGLFRHIRENKNIDYIEESDDESDFENISNDKYVDLNKHMNMECVFYYKFKKWVPVRIANDNAVVVNIAMT